MKKVSRAKNRLSLISLIIFLALISIGYLLKNVIMMVSSFPFLFITFILLFTANRCPFCGELFRGIYWSKSTAGYCRKCGKLIEFDDND